MQQDTAVSDDEQAQDPNWELASYGRRVAAWALDFVGIALPLILLFLGILVLFFGLLFLTHEASSEVSTIDPKTGEEVITERISKSVTMFGDTEISDAAATTITVILIAGTVAALIVWAGYIVWWLFALRRGQTPGKQVVGIRVIKDDGSPSGWGYTFLREFVIKFVLVGILSNLTMGAAWLIDYLWPLWDREKKMQTLHDKLLGTIVVRIR